MPEVDGFRADFDEKDLVKLFAQLLAPGEYLSFPLLLLNEALYVAIMAKLGV